MSNASEGASSAPPDFKLNAEQLDVVGKLLVFLQSDQLFYGVFGAAGTGKTSVICALFQPDTLKAHYPEPDALIYGDHGQSFRAASLISLAQNAEVCLAAPTHKAVGVLQEKANGLDVATVHRLLGCKKVRDDKTGKEAFLPASPSEQMIGNYDVVVVDECSMIGDTLFGWLTQAAEHHQVKLIWLGDPYQLPPVNDGTSDPAFNVKSASNLKQIMRHQGVIQRACNAVRLSIDRGSRRGDPVIADAAADEHGEIVYFPNTEVGLDGFFNDYISSSRVDFFESYTESSKILAFKNDDVDFCNNYVRDALFGDSSEPFIAGERLTVRKTGKSLTGDLLYAEEDVTVEEVERSIAKGVPCWRLVINRGYTVTEINALGSAQDKDAYMTKRKKLADAAKKNKDWRDYFNFVDSFTMVRPGYATTIHKSQGSTYDRVYLLQSEMLDLWDKHLRNSLLYVAYTRARSGLYLI